MLIAWNQLPEEYLHHENQQMLQTRNELVIKLQEVSVMNVLLHQGKRAF